MRLILHGLEPLHWAWAGLGIAAITLALLVVGRCALGISTGLENLCALALDTPYFRRPDLRESARWRLPFLAGLVTAGVLSAVLAGGWRPLWDLGRFDAVVGWGPVGKSLWMFVGGVLIGFGTRFAGGCTSGHGIFGISTLQWASLRTTLAFMGAGVVTAHLVYRVLWGGG